MESSSGSATQKQNNFFPQEFFLLRFFEPAVLFYCVLFRNRELLLFNSFKRMCHLCTFHQCEREEDSSQQKKAFDTYPALQLGCYYSSR